MIKLNRTTGRAGLAAVAFLTAIGSLHAQHLGDMAVYQDVDGKITTHSPIGAQPMTRVFRGIFDLFGPTAFVGDDPGVNMMDWPGATPPAGFFSLPPEELLNLNLVPIHVPGQAIGNLLYWDGSTMDVEFTAPPANHLLIVQDYIVRDFALDGSLQRHDGLVAGLTNEFGGMHEHPPYVLENEGSAASPGFYLMGWEFAMSGLETARHALVAVNPGFIPADVQNQFESWLENNLPTMAGDFDDNGKYELPDVDGLVAAIASGANSVQFDLTLDGLVNLDDLDLWRTLAGAVLNESGGPVLKGDANLDGFVDGQDFIEWNDNKFTTLAAWSGGDFNADGVVDGQDFIEWNNWKFQAADGASAAVPEPGSVILIPAAIGMLLLIRRRPWS